LAENQARDARVRDELAKMGWQVVVLWQCEIASSCDLRSLLYTKMGALMKDARWPQTAGL
jgi:G:T-mismatch repair DNA endonuclease (very short patch repair protein)